MKFLKGFWIGRCRVTLWVYDSHWVRRWERGRGWVPTWRFCMYRTSSSLRIGRYEVLFTRGAR